MRSIKEVVTVAEALKRVGLDGLMTGSWAEDHVDWTGIPAAFACGDVRQGTDGRPERVSAALCGGGHILYSWCRVGGVESNRPFHLNSGLVVIVSTRDRDTVLRAAFTA